MHRDVINALLPEGAFWEPAAGSDYDKLLNGIGNNSDAVMSDMTNLAYIRTEAQSRSRLTSVIYNRHNTGAYDNLQSALAAAGFTDCYVYPNTPPVNPANFLTLVFSLECGVLWTLPNGHAGQCGEPQAQCASVGGELVVNGDLYSPTPNYKNQCGVTAGTAPHAGDSIYAGDFNGYQSGSALQTYSVPTDSGYWGLIFFVGGPATYNTDGSLKTINFYVVPSQRRAEFRRVILKFKPWYSWGGLIVVYN